MDWTGSVTLGGGYGFAEGKAPRNPMAILGATRRLSRRFSFVTEYWLFPNVDRPLVSFGVRTIGEGASWDLGVGSMIFVPWIRVAWKF